MIFLGDIASPGPLPGLNEDARKIFSNGPAVANLEGPFTSSPESHLDESILFNSDQIIPQLKELDVQILNLANNHIMDLGTRGLEKTVNILDQQDLRYLGAGRNFPDAETPLKKIINGNTFVFLSFGWEPIQCQVAGYSRAGVNPLIPGHVLSSVREARKKNPDVYLVLLFHWNYELELYPQPRDRQLARLCIDNGADAIIGCHSHLVQGIEMYRNAPIVYGLGNWYIPFHRFFGGKLAFPADSTLQMALEWSPPDEPLCHWFRYHPSKNEIEYIESEKWSESEQIQGLTPYKDFDHVEYGKWFRQNRKKRKALPVYRDVNDIRMNKVRNYWVKVRGQLIDLSLRLGLKKIRRDL